jgi:hypothetical protein
MTADHFVGKRKPETPAFKFAKFQNAYVKETIILDESELLTNTSKSLPG